MILQNHIRLKSMTTPVTFAIIAAQWALGLRFCGVTICLALLPIFCYHSVMRIAQVLWGLLSFMSCCFSNVNTFCIVHFVSVFSWHMSCTAKYTKITPPMAHKNGTLRRMNELAHSRTFEREKTVHPASSPIWHRSEHIYEAANWLQIGRSNCLLTLFSKRL